ncbi:MAG: hypothetical protein PHY43_03955 [Verrucomicrobiales bacterium]|nr:hypothetical protein [Verrucomicrobiales bacterium]
MASLKARAALANLCLLRLKQLGGRATAREIAADLDKPLEQIQPRFSDLYAEHRIRDTGLRVKGHRGRPQVVWADAATIAADDHLHFETPGEFQAAGGKPSATALRGTAKQVQEDTEPAWFKRFGQ